MVFSFFAATVLGAVALYVNYGLSLISEHDKALSSLPLNLGVMATLLWFLQPEFSIPEVTVIFFIPILSSLLCFFSSW